MTGATLRADLFNFMNGQVIAFCCFVLLNVSSAIVKLLWGPSRKRSMARVVVYLGIQEAGLYAVVVGWPKDDGIVVLGYVVGGLLSASWFAVRHLVEETLTAQQPSRVARLLVRALTPVRYYDDQFGDLLEMYHDVKVQDGPRAANVILWSHVFRIIFNQMLDVLGRFADIAGKLRNVK